jgi:hypothetical protein
LGEKLEKKEYPGICRTISQDKLKLFASSIAARAPAVKTVDTQTWCMPTAASGFAGACSILQAEGFLVAIFCRERKTVKGALS